MGDNRSLIAARRRQLGAFLRQRREALDPGDFGFSTARRHVAGLRREEIAHLAEISASWYAMLEQGRVTTIGERTLARVADALRLSASEREFVTELARAPKSTSAPPLPASLRSFVARPASAATLLMNARFDVIAWNDASDELFGYSDLAPPLNLLELLLFEERVAARFVDRTGTLRNMIAFLHARLAIGDGEDVEAFATSLAKRSDVFRSVWADRAVALAPEPACAVVLQDGTTAIFSLDALVPLGATSAIVVVLTRRDQRGAQIL